MKPHYDVLIIGGGMVGASLAAALLPRAQELALNIAVVERFPVQLGQEYSPSYDSRATALAYGSRSCFEQMGVWEHLKQKLTAIDQIHVSDKGRFGATRLHANEEGVAALGYVVENQWLGQVLLQHISTDQAAESIDLISPASVTSLKAEKGGMRLSLEQDGVNHDMTAELVVMADGGRSELREQLGIGYQNEQYQQHAVIANISPEMNHQHIAYERFTDTGPMALLPLSDQSGMHRCGLVWTVPDEQIDEVIALNDQAFMAEVQKRFGYRAGSFVKVGERFHYPLKLMLADEQVRSNLVILGNAAHALHPIAGQGFNLALRGVVSLAETILEARGADDSIGDIAYLQRYYQGREQDQQNTIAFSDYTMKMFSNKNPLLSLGRSIGLQMLDMSSTAKTVFARSAMGLDQPAPKLK